MLDRIQRWGQQFWKYYFFNKAERGVSTVSFGILKDYLMKWYISWYIWFDTTLINEWSEVPNGISTSTEHFSGQDMRNRCRIVWCPIVSGTWVDLSQIISDREVMLISAIIGSDWVDWALLAMNVEVTTNNRFKYFDSKPFYKWHVGIMIHDRIITSYRLVLM